MVFFLDDDSKMYFKMYFTPDEKGNYSKLAQSYGFPVRAVEKKEKVNSH
jgi:hypothetical protein